MMSSYFFARVRVAGCSCRASTKQRPCASQSPFPNTYLLTVPADDCSLQGFAKGNGLPNVPLVICRRAHSVPSSQTGGRLARMKHWAVSGA